MRTRLHFRAANIGLLTLPAGAEGVCRLLREYGTGETPQAPEATRRLPVPPAESEAPGAQINNQVQQ
ncbi:hypothetical protein [Bacillus sp. V33-4]|uniref:hypothetical protein n=1 Tax=Bacillus sp. V33-4 TaxID=2054169 RepID=UPI001157FA41|nr:hypothetical protein [Bacillus sp. V33-4]